MKQVDVSMKQVGVGVSIDQAISCHLAGRLDEAERIYRQILELDPGCFDCLHLLGVIRFQQGSYSESLCLINLALAKNIGSAPAHNNRGAALRGLGRLEEALASFEKALELNANYADAMNNRGAVLNELGRNDEAVACYDKALAIKPDYGEALNNRGKALSELRRYGEALVNFDQALAVRPNYAEALHNRGNVLNALRRYDEALAFHERALSIVPNYADALSGCGAALNALGKYAQALANYDKALLVKPNDAHTINSRGDVLRRMKRYSEALMGFDHAIVINPHNAEAHNNRGMVLKDLNRLDEALTSYDRAVALRPDYAKAFNNRGNVLQRLERPHEAAASYDKAIAIRPEYASAFNNRGNALHTLQRFAEAIESFDRAIALKSDYAVAYSNKGNALKALRQFDDAVASYDTAIAVDLACVEAHYNRGIILMELGRSEDALASYEKAFALNPNLRALQGARLHAKMHLCDWSNFASDCSRLLAALSEGIPVSQPFPLVSIPCKPDDQLKCAQLYIADRYRDSRTPYRHDRPYSHDRIRIGYLSADFHDHPTAFLMAGMFELHDRERFETIAISFGPDRDNDMRRRLKRSFDQFIDASTQSDDEIAELVYRLEIDIAIDLKGFTKNTRLNVFAKRPAPLQVTYLGYPGTLGASYIDYLIADRIVIPREHQYAYSEKIVYLPDSYQVNDRDRPIRSLTLRRADAGLPEQGFVFCSFNNNYKITPDIFDVWMRLLRDVKGSVLWLLEGLSEGNVRAAANLRREAERRGVSGDRLIFAPRLPSEYHLARHQLADLFLDTLHCNAHTTASDALWAGLPIVTCLGSTFAGRVAGSLLNSVGLPELITDSLEGYEALALRIARDPSYLASLKAKLAYNRDICPLFDTAQFVRYMEIAYRTMWERHQQGQPPASFAVDPIG